MRECDGKSSRAAASSLLAPPPLPSPPDARVARSGTATCAGGGRSNGTDAKRDGGLARFNGVSDNGMPSPPPPPVSYSVGSRPPSVWAVPSSVSGDDRCAGMPSVSCNASPPPRPASSSMDARPAAAVAVPDPWPRPPATGGVGGAKSEGIPPAADGASPPVGRCGACKPCDVRGTTLRRSVDGACRCDAVWACTRARRACSRMNGSCSTSLADGRLDGCTTAVHTHVHMAKHELQPGASGKRDTKARVRTSFCNKAVAMDLMPSLASTRRTY